MSVDSNLRSPETSRGWLAFLIERSPFWVVFAPLAFLFVLTANISTHNHIDPLTNAVTAWHLGMEGSVILPDHAEAATPERTGSVGWIVESPRGPVSQYPPGAAALAAPFYWLADEPMTFWYVDDVSEPDDEPIPFPLPDAWPATVVAALATAAAMGFVAASVPHAGGTWLQAVTVGYVGGLATPMWATASDALWQHGPGAMWVALGILLAAKSRFLWSGLAFGAAVLTRPHLAVVAAAVGVLVSVSRRSLEPVLKVGWGSALGLTILLWFNWWLWGSLTISGGYGDVFVSRAVSLDLVAYAQNVFGALFDPRRGLLVYAPFLLLLIPGLRAGWRKAPDWGRAAAVGGVLYLLVQLKANRFSGGEGFIGYRYPLETLTSSAVVLFAAYLYWIRERAFANRVFWVAVGVAVLPQVFWKIWWVPRLG